MSARKLEKIEGIDPRVRDVLKLLSIGIVLAATFIMPGTAVLLKEYSRFKLEKDRKEWEKFNSWRLRQVIKRLHKEKVVEVKHGEVKITDKGRQKLIRFELDIMEIKRKTDGKWRLIIYDISEFKKWQRELFRETLKRLKLYRLQDSVYLTPFVCEDEIEYLRQTFDVGKEVHVLKVSKLENDRAYRNYFGI